MNITQKTLAARCGVSQPYINNILRGRRKPNTIIAARLESATGKHRLFWLYPGEYDEAGRQIFFTPPPDAPCVPQGKD